MDAERINTWSLVLERTHDAVCKFAEAVLSALARRAVHRLKRIGPTGVYGEQHELSSLWKEYCFQVHEGAYSPLQNQWNEYFSITLGQFVEEIPRHVAVLLSIFAARELDEDDEPESIGYVWPEGIARILRARLAEQASV